MKVLLWTDQHLDPRLRRRVSWFEDAGYNVKISNLKRAQWFSNSNFSNKFEHISYNSKKIIKTFNNDIIYISGAKILIDNYFLIFKLKQNNKIFIEIPDLPLRSRYKTINTLYSCVFKMLVRSISKNIIVTSPAFSNKLYSKSNFFILENIIDYSNAKRLNKIQIKRSEKIKIGYIGVIRYLEQIELALKFIYIHHEKVELHIFGGPIDKIQGLVYKYNLHKNIFMHGPYSFENDIVNIYKSVDIVYAVYDAKQANVQLALPNKLYEAVLAKTWILVAKETYLAKIVEENKIGTSLPSQLNKFIEFETILLNFLDEIKDSKKFNIQYSAYLIDESQKQKENFLNYIKNTIDE